ncbi:MAG TPA: adenylate/guanylate cyclase domain-containing protein [Spirochaetota bacterium]|nr:adenylate/guanylate cyclase domain-containing protein [Spirochaetota bacterium]HOS32273.1 adenylate/guanylate cyclase domain-containing protein [Spirochaetota bacterium]HOS55684.1 adenylate/guanylate cyclase domain-containing protein [Spirochaetota bacterium]HQF78067.1 adenylate/guanylate cyclase domain-containing protein [Spirochaetota bacterium]HQH29987.1 adenylate/guanylate cyclase domain-containing protein [Spirochaetota bacterium]
MKNRYESYLKKVLLSETISDIEKIENDIINEIFNNQNEKSGIDCFDIINIENNYFKPKDNDTKKLLLIVACLALIRNKNSNISIQLVYKYFSISREELVIDHSVDLFKGIIYIFTNKIALGIKNLLSYIKNIKKSKKDNIYELYLAYFSLGAASLLNNDINMASDFFSKQIDICNEDDDILFYPILNKLLTLLLLDSREEYSKHLNIINGLNLKENQKYLLKTVTTMNDLVNNQIDVDINEIKKNICDILNSNDHFSISVINLFPESFLNDDFATLINKKTVTFSEILSLLLQYKYTKLVLPDYVKLCGHISFWGLTERYKTLLNHIKSIDNIEYNKIINSWLMSKDISDYMESQFLSENNTKIIENAFILFLDIIGYSSISENMNPSDIYPVINPLFKLLNKNISNANGTIVDFMGDAVMAVFNCFKNKNSDIVKILFQMIDFINKFFLIRNINYSLGIADLDIGIGINSGKVCFSVIGSLERGQFTTLGNATNIAARLEALTRKLPGRIAVAENSFHNRVENIWNNPGKINFSMRLIKGVELKNIKKPVNVYSADSLIRFWVDFVPMGYTALEEDNILYIDTGGKRSKGILDHHNEINNEGSVCEILNNTPDLYLEKFYSKSNILPEFRMHMNPDFDCISTFYCAQELLDINPRKELLKKFSLYVSEIDRGNIPNPDFIFNSLFGIFISQINISKNYSDFKKLKEGLKVIDAALYIAENESDSDFSNIFYNHQNMFPEARELLREDFDVYQNDFNNGFEYDAPLLSKGILVKKRGLWLNNPQSILFKLWTRNPIKIEKKFDFMTVYYYNNQKNRYVISVDPESIYSLKGLGALLEKEESAKRASMNLQRPEFPKRVFADNSDPWYFGNGHNFTIIDSPFCGSVLTKDEILNIHKNWDSIDD